MPIASPDDRPCIAVTPDPGFELPLRVLLATLGRAHDSTGCRIFVFHGGFSPEAIATISGLVEAPSTIEWHPVDRARLAGCEPAKHLPQASLYPLVVPDLLPADVHKIIYLDVDTIVLSSLAELWRTPLDGRVLGAVRGAFMPWVGAVNGFPWEALQLPPDTPYFNNGVMLIDVAAWHRSAVFDRARQLLRQHRFDYGEQDALNALLAASWKPLHPRWNLQTGHFGNPIVAWVTDTVEWVDEAMADPVVVHYNGPEKPWDEQCQHPMAQKWRECLQRARESERRLQNDPFRPPAGPR